MERELESYILTHFEHALSDGSIQPYYQPVVRTISGQLCSFEALARWVDPERGVIRPDQFIPVLERERLIHKLDICIIRQVCQRLRSSVRRREIPIPVSVNLSRLDFTLCDIFSEVDALASRFQIPHDFLYIEVTESLMAQNEENMRLNINRFRDAGYQIWMDDFGSGYSSLNLLKDFVFDEIKMDMRFLSSFNQRSRRILTAVVQMAKDINIHTLAEGVETKEQYRFLRNIGCEKVQGYFFGRPMPYDQALAHLKATGVSIEAPQLRRYYDDIGRVNLLSAVPFMTQQERDSLTSARQLNSIPLAILQVQKEGFSILFCNAAFEEMSSGAGLVGNLFSQDLIGVEQPFSLLSENLRGLLDSTRNGEDGRMVFISHEEYYEIQTRCIAHSRDRYSVLMRLNNLSKAAKSTRTGYLDDGLRQVYALFERITLINTNTDTIVPLYVAARENMVSKREDISELAQEYAFRWILPEDQGEYLAFIEPGTLEQRICQSGRNHINACFRTSVMHGEYQWKQYTVLRLETGVYLLLIRNVHDQALQLSCKLQHIDTADRGVLTPELLWKNLTDSDLLRIFWKDRERRFQGASQAFLDYYGFDALEDILGKTDEDLHWHVRPDHYMNDEMLVIHEGLVTHNIPGRCIRNGENREILASKMPVRDGNGQIQGLMGYFIDRELLTLNDSRGSDTVRRDMLTGLLNARGLAEEARIYQDEYFLRNADFACIHVEVDDFQLLIQQYGFDFADKVMVEVGNILRSVFGLSAAVGRFEGYEFVVYYQVQDIEEAATLRSRIRQAASAIQEIDGVPLTLYLSVGYALFSEFENLDELTKKAEARLLSDHTSTASNETLLNRSRELFHLYDNIPIPFAVFRVLQDEDVQETDTILFYANKLYEKNSGHTNQEMLGKNARSLFPDLGEDWYAIALRAAQGETVTGKFYFKPAQMDYYITASQVIRPGFCAITFLGRAELENALNG